jgi:hypothetical protein
MNQSLESARSLLESLSPKDSQSKTSDLVSKVDYDKLIAAKNITSYSKLGSLHACPRKYQLSQYDAVHVQERVPNVDFSFGHAVGAGFQEYFATKDMDKALWQCFLAWDSDLLIEPAPRKKKFYPLASLAVQQVELFLASCELDEYEIAILPSGRSAIEVSFVIDCENGFLHRGHIDLIARNIKTGRIAVIEVKTSGFKGINAAIYYNSDQALSYSVIVDSLFPGTQEFEVFYVVYSVPDERWNVLPISKPVSAKAEFLSTLLLDHATIKTYEKLDFYPRRGSACYSFSRDCKYLMQCGAVLKQELPIITLEEMKAGGAIDFFTSASELRIGLTNLNAGEDNEIN